MLVWKDGQSGTIGGGALELEAVTQARRMTPSVARVPLGPALGQCCGGAVTLVTEVFDAGIMPALNTDGYARRVEGLCEQPLSITRAIAHMRNGSDNALVFSDGWLYEPTSPARAPLWVWGAGHVGRAIVASLAPTQLFDITWVDSSPERFPPPTPNVTHLCAATIPDAAKLAPRDAQHLILTYSHSYDLELCHRLLAHGFSGVGLIGSTTKWARFRSKLRDLGHESAKISGIRCPIGQPALGKHPQAIAVGVASELLLLLQTNTVGKDVAI